MPLTVSPAIVGVVRAGEVARTSVDPEPVVAAAAMVVPLPCRNPETLVPIVMFGVAVGFDMASVKPLAFVPATLVTVPPPPPPPVAAIVQVEMQGLGVSVMLAPAVMLVTVPVPLKGNG